MKTLLLAALGVVAFATQSGPRVRIEPMLLSIESADSTMRPTMHISIDGNLFHSLGILRGTTGFLSLHDSTGTGSGSLRGELTTETGILTFSVPESGPEIEMRVWPSSDAQVPRYQARGHTVRVFRSVEGTLFVMTGR